MGDKKRIASLDGLRGIAAIAVTEFHFNIFFLPQARLFDIFPYLNRAYLAVDLFFLLSGFVMAHVYGQTLGSNWRVHWREFAIARFARLYPLFAVTTLALVIIVTLSNTPISVPAPVPISLSGGTLALQPFLLQQWATSGSWNYPSWSISTEAEAYVYFVFFAGLLIKGTRPRLLAASFIFVLVALSVSKGGDLNFALGPRALLRTISEFSLGVLIYRAYASDFRIAQIWVASSAIVFAGLAAVTHLEFLIVGAFGSLIYYCVNATDALTRVLNSRPLTAVGNWSYSIYLWHAPTHFAVMAVFAAIGIPVSNLGLWSARLLLVATTLVVVAELAISYHYFETPMRRLILSLFPRMNQLRATEPSKPLALS